MSYWVNTVDILPLTLNETDERKSILQNVAIILSTQKGTVPMYREFGLNMKWLDKPIHVARTLLYSDVKENVEEFEPRVKVLNVSSVEDENVPGKLIPTVEVEIVGS